MNWEKSLNHDMTAGLREWLEHSGSFMQRLDRMGIKDAAIQVLQQEWQEAWECEREMLGLLHGSGSETSLSGAREQAAGRREFDSSAAGRRRATLEPTLIREVLIASQPRQWMFARTVFPRSLLAGKYECLAHLENRALGSVLFNDPDMKRGPFEFIELQPTMPLYKKTLDSGVSLEKNTRMWARRSVFTLKENPLLLSEVFLPDLMLL